MKELMGSDYREFINYFNVHFQYLRSKFPDTITWKLPGGVKQSANISDEDFQEFRLIELEWLITNGFLPNNPKRPMFAQINEGDVSVIISSVIAVKKITDETTAITINEMGKEVTYNVIGSMEYVNKKLLMDGNTD